MLRLLRFSPSRLALGYIALSVVALALLAAPLWYAWRTNIATFRAYIQAEDVQRLVDVFNREGANGLAAAMQSQVGNLPEDEIMILADASKLRVAGNLPAWPPQVPDAPGTYGLVIDVGGGATMRVVASHVALPGGYHLLIGRESVRFRSLVELFWYGIAGAVAIVLVLAAVIGWVIHRALLSEVDEVSRTASAIVGGDLSRRLATSSGSPELDSLARTVNGMVARLATQNMQLESEIAVRRQAEQALHRVHKELEGVVAQRTGELARANESLQRSEERYARAIDASDEGQWDVNPSTGEIFVSARMKQIFGFDANTHFRDHAEYVARAPFHPDDRQRVLDTFQALVAGGSERYEMEYRIVPRPGEVRWVRSRAKAFRDGRGVTTRMSGSLTDITERKRIEEELRARQEMLDLAQKAARAVAFEWRLGAGEGQNRWSSDLEAMYGLAPGSYDGTFAAWQKLVFPEDWPEVKAAIDRATESGDVVAEYRVVHRDGSAHWLQAKARMLFDGEGQPGRVVGFMLDVTERHAAEAELRRLERQLRQAQRLEAMGTLAGGIAHDFNNILGAILGYGEMALRGAAKGSRLRRDLESIMMAGERGRALVERILAFSRSGVGERRAVHVEKVVGEALDLLEAKLPNGVAIERQLHADSAAVLGDPTQVHQVLMNLVTNAVQAMPSGGALRVSLEGVRLGGTHVATVGALGAGDYVVLEVADSGTGMSPEVLERIFDPFFTTKEVGVGTGLGLSLVHGIVTQLGGAIDVASAVGEGSVFTVYLPRAGEAADDLEREEPEAPRGDHQHVLIVDDEEPLVRLATETLEELGYVAVGFTSSAAALAAFRTEPERFDAVITDERMPGMSGSALIREIRGIRRAIPILLVSGYVGGEVVRRALESGADEVLKKPLSAHELATSLARVLHA
jgi:PAS domain S-box-containing protein